MTFQELKINKSLQQALSETPFDKLTSIQEKSFSVVMSGADVVAIAQTGTGKTLAYLLPIIQLLPYSQEKHPRVIILVPTRELVVQVEAEIKKLTTYMSINSCGVFGGTNMKTQALFFQEKVDIVVATPGRLLDLILGGFVSMKSLKHVVIDEVDEMLNLGFRTQIERVFDLFPKKRQNLMFSATLTDEIELLINTFFHNTVKIEAAPSGTPIEKIVLCAYKYLNFNTKINLLQYLLKQPIYKKTLIFVKSKSMADRIFETLQNKVTIPIGVIHSNKEQNYRFRSVEDFKNGMIDVLIATDIISRGIDIEDVSHVINFDLPEVPEKYIHRIGRTGRADKDGIAISFVSEDEQTLHESIEAFIQKEIEVFELPAEVEISTVLIPEEMPNFEHQEIKLKLPKIDINNSAFHEKSKKNQKVNVRVSRREKMMAKYGKPITRGQKK